MENPKGVAKPCDPALNLLTLTIILANDSIHVNHDICLLQELIPSRRKWELGRWGWRGGRGLRRFFGVVALVMGIALAGWILYNLFIERQPETQGKSPLPAILIAAAFIYVGVKWIRRETAG